MRARVTRSTRAHLPLNCLPPFACPRAHCACHLPPCTTPRRRTNSLFFVVVLSSSSLLLSSRLLSPPLLLPSPSPLWSGCSYRGVHAASNIKGVRNRHTRSGHHHRSEYSQETAAGAVAAGGCTLPAAGAAWAGLNSLEGRSARCTTQHSCSGCRSGIQRRRSNQRVSPPHAWG